MEEEGCGLVAARGFSRLFSKLLGPSEGDGGEERVTVHVGVDAWGRPVVGAMKVRRGEEEEVVVGAEWEAGALGAGPELEAAAAVEAAMAAADGEVAAAEAARNALEGAVYRARCVVEWGGWVVFGRLTRSVDRVACTLTFHSRSQYAGRRAARPPRRWPKRSRRGWRSGRWRAGTRRRGWRRRSLTRSGRN